MVAVRLDRQSGKLAPADDVLELCWATPDRLPHPLCADVQREATAALHGQGPFNRT